MPRIPPEQLINTLFGPPKTDQGKKLADFAAKSIPKPEKPPSMETERFVVRDAVNPYREAILESGIVGINKNRLSAEKEDREINLSEILAADIESYRQSGLVSWAEALDQAQADLANLSPDKLKVVEQ